MAKRKHQHKATIRMRALANNTRVSVIVMTVRDIGQQQRQFMMI
jgi:hypothetical protein